MIEKYGRTFASQAELTRFESFRKPVINWPVQAASSLNMPGAMLAYIRKDGAGKLVYLFALARATNSVSWMTFSTHGEAFQWAVDNGLEFVHQPWSRSVEDKIRELLEQVSKQ